MVRGCKVADEVGFGESGVGGRGEVLEGGYEASPCGGKEGKGSEKERCEMHAGEY